MIPALMLAAAVSSPAAASRHDLTAALGYGAEGPLLVVCWTGRRRWGAWLRLDERPGAFGMDSGVAPKPNSTQTDANAASVGVSWRALPRLTLGAGYGEKTTTRTVYGSNGVVLEDHRDKEHGLAAIGTWTFPVNDTLGVAMSASGGPGGFGAAAGVTFFFP